MLRVGGPNRPTPNGIASSRCWCAHRLTAVLKAHGIAPKWRSYNWTALTPDCQQQFRKINLHWHDLRHEYASRLVERGVPLAQVRDLLGHASITTTERYDNQKLENLQAAALKLEDGKIFDPKVSRFFKI
jgi:integrase